MAKKAGGKKPEKMAPENPRALNVQGKPGESKADAMAHTSLRPTVQAALTLMEYNSKVFGEMSMNALVDDLEQQCSLANGADLRRAESLLIAQAHTLDAIFNRMARTALSGEYLAQTEACLRLALKAQGQCRATLETLAAIKYPRSIAFVTQANIAHGPQQVNNSTGETSPPDAPQPASRARESEKEQSKLLERRDGKRLDGAAPKTAIAIDPAMAALGTVDGPSNSRR